MVTFAHYRGKDSVGVAPGKITLEFVKHYHDVHPALHPDSLTTKQQSDADALAQETKREIRKRPEKKEEKETLLAARQKDAAERIEFRRTRSLRAITLDTGPPRSQRLGVIQQQEQMDRRLAEAGGIRATGALRKPDRRVPVLAAAERGRFNSAAPTGELIKKLRLRSAATLER